MMEVEKKMELIMLVCKEICLLYKYILIKEISILCVNV